jgi:hypothetical protein
MLLILGAQIRVDLTVNTGRGTMDKVAEATGPQSLSSFQVADL